MRQNRFLLTSLFLPLIMGASPCPPESGWENTQPFADAQAVTAITKAVQQDQEITYPQEFSSRVFLHRNNAGEVVKTPFVFISVHGLYNNPTVMTDPEQFVFDSGHNVVSVRLTGHFEHDRQALDRVKLNEWRAQVRTWRGLAKPFGEGIYWIGHSTGAALGLAETLENLEGVRGLFLFSPALKLHPFSEYTLKSLATLGVSGWLEDKLRDENPKRQYLSVPAGLEVIQLGEELRAALNEEALLRLKDLPVTVVDTPKDIVVDIDTNAEFVERLARVSPHGAHYRRVFHRHAMIHDKITLASAKAYKHDIAPLLKLKICVPRSN